MDGRHGSIILPRSVCARRGLTTMIAGQLFLSSSANITMMPLGPRTYVSL